MVAPSIKSTKTAAPIVNKNFPNADLQRAADLINKKEPSLVSDKISSISNTKKVTQFPQSNNKLTSSNLDKLNKTNLRN